MHTLGFEAIGTQWSLSTAAPLDSATRAAVADVVDSYDRTYSRFRSDSTVARMAEAAGSFALPASAAPLLRLFDSLQQITRGAVNPLVGRSLEVLGYDAGYSFLPSGPPAPAAAWTETVSWTTDGRGTLMTTAVPVTFDIGAAGKGQLVDLVSGVLETAGHREYVVDAGSDLRHAGAAPLRIALEHPYDAKRAIGVLTLSDRALCASAVNRRQWGDGLHHVLDARTGFPVDTVAATWVLAADAMTADGLATALFFAEPQELAGAFTFDYVRMFTDGRADYSPAMAGVLFP
ncbi:FAD:protein FMN transferase [Arthrobacter sp. zg-Y1171]|uniref:FAD:protein FMN transferase n=1 Tax=Arthrobacter sp. zg-Y1171 TaxID=2964610 RepID=UPI002108260E|nr:FAD:protein FMN transferase [Arthrobacter sp. zg-Y1171]MCQ1995024.1 FAD:protein FMN transferase [Arthrobacter sp. zg-Y1171]UWX80924.1 FAD:protein FMN transferase [Arthrobacter sp. zg-Y1171]